jgi:hypothetical protein
MGPLLIGPVFFKIVQLAKIGTDTNPAQPNKLLTADNGAGMEGDTQTVFPLSFKNGDSTNLSFQVGLGSRQPFTISLDLFGVPPGNALTADEGIPKAKAGVAPREGAMLLKRFTFVASDSLLSLASADSESLGSIHNIGVITGPGAQSGPAVAIDPVLPQRMAVAANDSAGDVIVSTTEDGGETWHATTMSRSLGDITFSNAQSPSLAFDWLGRLSVVYVLSNMNDARNAVVITESSDGVYFSSPAAISFHDGWENVIDSRPVIAISSPGGRYVAWENFGSRINVVRSEPGGLFGPPATVVDNALVSSPTLAISGSALYIGWNEWGFNSRPPFNTGGRLLMASSPLGAQPEFDAPREIARTSIGFASPPIRVRPFSPLGTSPNLNLAVDPTKEDLIYAAFADGGQDDIAIHLARSSDRGETWELMKVSNRLGPGNEFSPALALDSENVYVSFYHSRNDSRTADVSLARSFTVEQPADLGNSKSISFTYHLVTSVPIDKSPENLGTEFATNLGDRTAIAVSPENIVIAWTDTRRQSEDIYVNVYSLRH